MHSITVLTFGVIKDILGKSDFEMTGISSTEELKHKLENEFPKLKNINYALAVNRKTVVASAPLEEGATVALLPPFSGG